jgi:hypothetical protein
MKIWKWDEHTFSLIWPACCSSWRNDYNLNHVPSFDLLCLLSGHMHESSSTLADPSRERTSERLWHGFSLSLSLSLSPFFLSFKLIDEHFITCFRTSASGCMHCSRWRRTFWASPVHHLTTEGQSSEAQVSLLCQSLTLSVFLDLSISLSLSLSLYVYMIYISVFYVTHLLSSPSSFRFSIHFIYRWQLF